MQCPECSGSGACDYCDGYGTYPDSYPNAGDGPECDICTGAGICQHCGGTGETDPGNDQNNGNDESARVVSAGTSAS